MERAKESAMLLSRPEAEKEGSLIFDGFLSFHCKTRADSKRVIRELREVADCSVTIVTGDSVLTACHVAREVGLIDEIDHAGVAPGRRGKGKGNNAAGKRAPPKISLPKRKASKKTIKAISKSAPASEPTEKEGKKTALLLTAAEGGGNLRWVPLLPPSPLPENGEVETSSSSGPTPKTAAAAKTRNEDTSVDGGQDGGVAAGGGNGRQGDDKGFQSGGGDGRGGDDGGFEFSWAGVEVLAETHDLCATGPAFELALAAGDPEIGSAVQHFRVLARMTPGLKEELATLLIESGKTVLMCGDGSNDVGALRRSHVGLALLSGFGDANTDPGDGKTTSPLGKKTPPASSATTKSETASRKVEPGGIAAGKAGGGGAPGLKGKSAAEIRRDAQKKIQDDITVEFERLRKEGMNPATAMWKASLVAQKKKNAAVDGSALTTGAQGAFAASAMAMFKDDEEGEGQLGADGVVRTGDASLAAPFTSKKPSIAAVVDVVRQGRCTMAAVLHTYQMVALHALFSSYTSSVLYLMRVRWPQRPLILTSLMFQPLHLALASPGTTEDMSPLRPPRSVFHRSTFASLLGQAAVHVGCMMFAVRVAQAHSPEAQPVSAAGMLGRKFVPSLVSNVVFLLATIQSVSVTVVNFKGRPFMRGILESPAIFLPAVSIVVLCFALTFEIVPSANKLLELAVFPSVAAKIPVVLSMIASLVGPLLLDRLCVKLFDPELHSARKAEPPLGTVAKGNLALLGVLMVMATMVIAKTDFDTLEDTFGGPA